ncbi:MAG: T9SS type A sorting domain-containing protein [Bacteroidia bacterium]|nr:T9SS type A sorting domain-containing protein [Bacteroidia bacterium]
MNRLVLSCLLTTIISNCTAQVNEYFKGNPQWGITEQNYPNFPCYTDDTYNYITNGDTLLNNTLYKKIFQKGIISYRKYPSPNSQNVNCEQPSQSYIHNVPNFYLRSFNKKMYVKLKNDTIEKLLYDFNLNVGDTLPITYNNYEKNKIVSAIDSFYTPYGYRKRFSISNKNEYLIEGVGNTNGLLNYFGILLDAVARLNCYSLNDANYYPTTGGTCISLAWFKAKIANKTSVTISPNPFVNTATVEFTNLQSNATLYIYNTLGQLVQQQTILPTTTTVKLECSALPLGLYYYSLVQPNATNVVGNFVITN